MEHFFEVPIPEVIQHSNMRAYVHDLTDNAHDEYLSSWARFGHNAIQHLDIKSKLKPPPVKFKFDRVGHSLMALPKSQSAQRKILRRSSSADCAKQAPANKRTHYWSTRAILVFQGVSSSAWQSFQKTASRFQKAIDEV